MNVPREPILRRTAELLGRSRDDLHVAKLLLGEESPPAWAIAFHAQQAAEKAIKALLVFNGIDFAYTHDIRLLLDQVDRGPEWNHLVRQANDLTVYATTARYIIGSRDITKEQARTAFETAKMVVGKVTEDLESDGFPS